MHVCVVLTLVTLTYAHPHSLANSLTSPTHLLTHPPTHPPTHSLTDTPVCVLYTCMYVYVECVMMYVCRFLRVICIHVVCTCDVCNIQY